MRLGKGVRAAAFRPGTRDLYVANFQQDQVHIISYSDPAGNSRRAKVQKQRDRCARSPSFGRVAFVSRGGSQNYARPLPVCLCKNSVTPHPPPTNARLICFQPSFAWKTYSYAEHFMISPSGIAFNDDGSKFASSHEAVNWYRDPKSPASLYMGPS